MLYNQPYGISDTNGPYINGDPTIGQAGSIPPAAAIEYPQRELVNFFTDSGLTPTNADLHQLSKSVQAGMMHYGVDTGTVNNIQINLTPAPDTYYDGMFLFVVPIVTNTGASTIMLNGMAARNIVRRGGAALQAGDMPAGYKSLVVYSKTHANFELYGINFAAGGGFLPILSANTTWYVDAAIGDDTLYDGTAAAISGPHGPFKTIGKAMNVIFTYGPSVYLATISVAAGTYHEAVATPAVVGPRVLIKGASYTNTFVTGANNTHTFSCGHANTMSVQNICVSCGTGTGPPCCFVASGGASLSTSNTASSGTVPYSVWEAYAGYITAGSHIFNPGNSAAFVFASFFGGFLGCPQSQGYTFQGPFSLNSGGAFAAASAGSSMEMPVPGQPSFGNPTYVTGYKYEATINGVIVTQGLGVSYFPGTLAGYTNTGGQYN